MNSDVGLDIKSVVNDLDRVLNFLMPELVTANNSGKYKGKSISFILKEDRNYLTTIVNWPESKQYAGLVYCSNSVRYNLEK